MKQDRKIKRMIEQSSVGSVISSVMTAVTLEKLMLQMCNQCIYKSNNDKSKKRRRQWHNAARVLHRIYDEMNLEKQKRNVFKIVRRDYYLCPKCKKKFRVDPFKEENCKYELDRNLVVAKCPHCGFSE